MTHLRLLLAPDSFKGTLSAQTVAQALSVGARRAGADVVQLPLADGGEGTMEILRSVLGGELNTLQVTGPLGEPVPGAFVLTDGGRTAVLDTATASGLHLVPDDARDAEAATSYGTGELIAAAAAAGATRIYLGVGGSACTDGGQGALDAIAGGGGLRGAALTVLCDVQTAFEYAPSVFAPQKGADPAAVQRLEWRLNALAERFPRDPRGCTRTGAAGGLSGGLWAVLGAELVSGIDCILDLVGFDTKAAAADAALTGEGRLDSQTAHGKVVAGVCRRAAAQATPVYAVVGRRDLDAPGLDALGLIAAVEAGTVSAISAAAEQLTHAVRKARKVCRK